MARITFENSRKHLQDEVRVSPAGPGLHRHARSDRRGAARGTPIYSVTNCTIAPAARPRVTEAHILMARAGCPCSCCHAADGTTGPMSVLGTSILNMAELLSAVVLFELAAPGCALVSRGSAVARCAAGSTCRHPRRRSYQPDLHRMSHFYGLYTQGSAVSADAKACDLQPGEACSPAWLRAGGLRVMLAFGLLDSAQTPAWPRPCSTPTP